VRQTKRVSNILCPTWTSTNPAFALSGLEIFTTPVLHFDAGELHAIGKLFARNAFLVTHVELGSAHRSDRVRRMDLECRRRAAHRSGDQRMELAAEQTNLARRADAIDQRAVVDCENSVLAQLQQAVVDQPDRHRTAHLRGDSLRARRQQENWGEPLLAGEPILPVYAGSARAWQGIRRCPRGLQTRLEEKV
jgi:hypothetical protein